MADPSHGMAPERLTDLLRPFYETQDARDTAVALLNAIVSAEAVMLGGGDRKEVKAGIARMLVDFSVQLYANPFWQRFAANLQPVFAMAVLARLDSYGHSVDRAASQPHMAAFMSARQAAGEVAVSVLLHEQGSSGLQTHAKNLRLTVVRELGGF